MPFTSLDQRTRGRRLVAGSGDTRFFVVPQNRIAHATELEVDTRNLSGITGVISLQIRDSFAAIDGSSGSVIRKEVGVKAGDMVSFQIAGVQLLGGVDIRSSFSGPIVSLAIVLA